MFKKVKILIFLSLIWSHLALAKNPIVIMKTSMGELEIELFKDKAPLTVKNFLSYMKDGSYNGTIFHRVIQDFIIQGGHYDEQLTPRKRKKPIINEASNGLKNIRGTLAMSRRTQRNSATDQFFINLSNNPALDHVDDTDQGFGYAVFGKIKKGIKILSKINKVQTSRKGVFPRLPVKNVVINSIEVKK